MECGGGWWICFRVQVLTGYLPGGNRWRTTFGSSKGFYGGGRRLGGSYGAVAVVCFRDSNKDMVPEFRWRLRCNMRWRLERRLCHFGAAVIRQLLNQRVTSHMGKRVRRSSVCSEKKMDNHFKDKITHLPKEILIYILSLLTLKEAGRSSVLSHGWKDLWKFTSVLNFDSPESVRFSRKVRRNRERSKYVTWVNRVLELHQCPYLDEFRVSFDMNRDASHDIDEWINFAIPKGLKRLEIDFTSYFSGSDNRYSLSQRCYSCFKRPHNLSRIKSLNSLTLKDVNVNGELLEFLLSNCPLLEFLCVYCSEHIVNLKVAGPSLLLKHLEIFRCMHLESLDVSAPKLVTFKYFGKKTQLRIRNLPLLSKLYIGGPLRDQVIYALVPFSSHLSHIETLELEIRLEGNEEIPKALEFTTLKHLNISIRISYDKSLLGFTSLLEAAPSLRKLTLQVLSLHPSMQRVPEVLTPRPHQCLKVVEMIGFSGGTTDLEFFTYLLQSAINLDRIIFDPYHPREFKGEQSEEKDEARKRARQLAKRLPPGVKSAVR
ncbi:hypothetical protein RHMOL_Rhmol08G0243600 [Rhododendron molle]|uniref:Uncharacterized protein n=1 Tax=Rhododendron molle TaxID=49168 RepID=A0ACC0MS69_RHOML|nr:hypothetical protein RHMOL_Rhmol08G0243600 [Rhododendron molle]